MDGEALATFEDKLLCMTVQDACRLARIGETNAALRCLSLNLEHVAEMARTGEAWAQPLLPAYRSALDEFSRICARSSAAPRRR